MTAIEQAIKEAVRNDWVPRGQDFKNKPLAWKVQAACKVKFKERFFLDSLFWQALGKARGWGGDVLYEITERMEHESSVAYEGGWDVPTYQMHRFFDHIMSGKDAESFFASLV